jgi:PKD repeat protein
MEYTYRNRGQAGLVEGERSLPLWTVTVGMRCIPAKGGSVTTVNAQARHAARAWFSRGRVIASALSGALLVAMVVAAPPASADVVPHDKVVTADADRWTPHVLDGEVRAFAEVGNVVVVGGDFTRVRNEDDPTEITRVDIFAFNKGTGTITSFAPVLNGDVYDILPTGDGQTVWIAGGFTSVNGAPNTRVVARVNVNTGAVVSSFQPPVIDGRIHSLALRGDRLYIAGRFLQIAGQSHTLLAALAPDTGALDPSVSFTFSEPRNGGTLNIVSMDVTPDGSKMVVIGNFTKIDGLRRYQIGVIDLGQTATLANWATERFTTACSSSFQTYMRDVDTSPDGKYFAVVTTGAYSGGVGSGTLCDSASRWEFEASGTTVQPTWVDYTGGDTLTQVEVTGAAVYTGGHNRWMNNPFRGDSAGQGAIERPGLSALDPRNGVPLTWNPGRTLGVGVFGFLATGEGLWIGSDTDRISNFQFRGRLAHFRLDSGTSLPPDFTGSLPGTVVSLGRSSGAGLDDVVRRGFDGDDVTSTTTTPGTVAWRNLRGAFQVGGKLYTGWSDGTFQVRSYDGTTFGAPQTINLNGLTNFANEMPNITGMFYDPDTGRLYFTLAGQSRLFYRYFSTESNIVGAVRFDGPTNIPGISWQTSSSLFLVDAQLFVSSSTGVLSRFAWNGTTPVAGTGVQVSGPGIDGQDWRARDAFVFAPEGGTPPNDPPVAQASATCDVLDCDFSAAGSSDPDGTITSYDWDFGDGTTGSGALVSHTYAASGTYTTTLTVTDDDNATTTDTVTVTVLAPNVNPTAAIDFSCDELACSFDGSGSDDPDGTISSYAWDFGDGSPAGSGETTSHTYAAAGSYTVTLTVTDDRGGTGTASVPVVVAEDGTPAVFRAAAQTNVNSTAPTVTVPASVVAGDTMLLFATVNTTSAAVSPPAGGVNGWTLVGSRSSPTAGVQTFLWSNTADPGDAGQSVTVPLSAFGKTALQLLAYTGTGGTPISAHGVAIDETQGTARTTPVVSASAGGSVLVSYWADKSSATTSWTTPPQVTVRSATAGTGSGRIVSAIGDTGSVGPGSVGGLTATADSSTSRGVVWSVVLAPSG